MSENHTTETKSVRELARAVIETQDIYSKAYWETCNTNLSPDERIDALLASDAALKVACAAKRALAEAQAALVAA